MSATSCIIKPMLTLILNLFRALRAGLRLRADLAIENLALRQQLAVLQRDSKPCALTRIHAPLLEGQGRTLGIRTKSRSD
jgi:hypothetical protein